MSKFRDKIIKKKSEKTYNRQVKQTRVTEPVLIHMFDPGMGWEGLLE